MRVHEQAISAKLTTLYGKPLAGLPLRVDVVQTVNWSGANTILLDPDGGHIEVSIEQAYGPSSLELVFHEASHTLMGRGSSIRNALRNAASQLDLQLPATYGTVFSFTRPAIPCVAS